jgi:hypothetical protein
MKNKQGPWCCGLFNFLGFSQKFAVCRNFSKEKPSQRSFGWQGQCLEFNGCSLTSAQSNLLRVQLIASLVLCLAAKMEQWAAGKVSVWFCRQWSLHYMQSLSAPPLSWSSRPVFGAFFWWTVSISEQWGSSFTCRMVSGEVSWRRSRSMFDWGASVSSCYKEWWDWFSKFCGLLKYGCFICVILVWTSADRTAGEANIPAELNPVPWFPCQIGMFFWQVLSLRWSYW